MAAARVQARLIAVLAPLLLATACGAPPRLAGPPRPPAERPPPAAATPPEPAAQAESNPPPPAPRPPTAGERDERDAVDRAARREAEARARAEAERARAERARALAEEEARKGGVLGALGGGTSDGASIADVLGGGDEGAAGVGIAPTLPPAPPPPAARPSRPAAMPPPSGAAPPPRAAASPPDRSKKKAKPGKKKDGVEQQAPPPRTTVDFDDDSIDGALARPDGESVEARHPSRAPPAPPPAAPAPPPSASAPPAPLSKAESAPRPAPPPAPPSKAESAPRPAPPPAPIRLERFPAIEAPAEIPAGAELDVLVSLSEEELTPDVDVVAGAATKGGRTLALALPEPAPARDGWTIKVVLTAGAFDLMGPNFAELELPRAGPSTPALFHLRARTATAAAPVFATFWHEHAFLGRAVKRIRIVPAPGAEVAGTPSRGEAVAPSRAMAGPSAVAPLHARAPTPVARGPALALGGPARAPDLTLTVIVGSDPAHPRRADVEVESPWLTVPRSTWEVPADLPAVLAREFARFARVSRGGRPLDDAPAGGASTREDVVELLRGFGEKRWQAAPAALQGAIQALQARLGDRFRTILVVTNEPRIPWELLAVDGEFLGTRYQVARWHLAESGGIRARPEPVVPVQVAVAVAPDYGPAERLPAQGRELAAVRAALGQGVAVVPGTRQGLREALRRGPPGLLHFAGHGAIGGDAVAPEYLLRLADATLSADGWRGMARGGGPGLVFLNACELGQADKVAGIVDGWAPAVLDGGAAGYVGGLWPLGDEAAADFARRFYAAVREGAPVAEALRRARRAFFEKGDPTYLAYVFYGDPYLELSFGDAR
jgi:hypothetical protein